MNVEQKDNHSQNYQVGNGSKGKLRIGQPEARKQLLVLAAVVAAFLPLLSYLVALGSISYIFFYHVLFNSNFQVSATVSTNGLAFVLPLLSGVAITLWLLKPFIPLKQNLFRSLEVTQDRSHKVNQLVREICVQIKIKAPIAIRVGIDPSIKMQSILIPGIARYSQILKIGLPLVANLKGSQLAVLICRQLALLRNPVFKFSYFALLKLDQFYRRNLSGDDGWRRWFADCENRRSNSLTVALALVGRTAVWLNDQIIAVMYSYHQRVSYRAIRMIEKDASLTAIMLCGSSSFLDALNSQVALDKVWHTINTDLVRHSPNPLVDDLPLQMSKSASKLNGEPQAQRNDIDCTESFAAWSFVEQIDFAQSEETNGIIELDFPATEFFGDFRQLCKTATEIFYKYKGLDFSSHELVPVITNDKQHAIERALANYLDEYTASTFTADKVWDVSGASQVSKMNDNELLQHIQLLIQRFRENLPNFQSAILRQNEIWDKLSDKMLVEIKYKKGLIDDQARATLLKPLNDFSTQLEHLNHSLTTLGHCSGMRVIATIFLSDERNQLRKALQLISYVQSLQTVERDIEDGNLLTRCIAKLQELMVAQANGELQIEIEQCGNSLSEHNRRIRAVLEKLPGSLKSVPSFQATISETINQRTAISIDSATATTIEFDVLHHLFRDLNQLLSGQLAAIATKIERMNAVEPIRLIPRQNSADAA